MSEDEETASEGDEWTYSKAGVDLDEDEKAISEIWKLVGTTFKFRRSKNGQPLNIKRHYAGLIDIGAGDKLVAVHADNVGTKVLVAQLLEKYDTVGIDLVAMNVNDLVCVGAEPIALVDYLAVEKYDTNLIREIVSGIVEGARRASIAIVGGETASVPDIIRGARIGVGFDLAGTTIGIVDRKSVILGGKMRQGDIVVGLASSGIHSNGLTMARKVLLETSKLTVDDSLPGSEFGVGEELLMPTKIYSPEVLEVIKETEVHGLAHITGGAFTKLRRIGQYAHVGFKLDKMPKPQYIFEAIAKLGLVSEEEMYRTFNMGIGFCIVTPKSQVEEVSAICEKHDTKAIAIGELTKEETIAIRTNKGSALKY
ncbi:MAG: phosphoribosylformylglycinamidine cyclo-ligase [Candidatus Atabeyarchaeum deiterrae]